MIEDGSPTTHSPISTGCCLKVYFPLSPDSGTSLETESSSGMPAVAPLTKNAATPSAGPPSRGDRRPTFVKGECYTLVEFSNTPSRVVERVYPEAKYI